MAKKRSRPSSRSRSRPARPRPRRRSAPRSVPHGVAIMDFCKEYNAATEASAAPIVPVEITVFEDRTFTFILKTPPTPVLLRQAAGLEKGSQDCRARGRRHGHRRAGHRDREGQDARPQRQRPRGGQAAGGRHGPVDGHQGRLDEPNTDQARPGPPRPAATTPEGAIMAKARSTRTPRSGSTASSSILRPRRSSW